MADPTMADLVLEAARRDVDAYMALVQHEGIHDSILGFHAQQAIEKAIKAVLFKRGVMVPRTHNIGQLLIAIDDAAVSPPPHEEELDSLNPYAVAARYGALDSSNLDRAITASWLKDMLAWTSGFWLD